MTKTIETLVPDIEELLVGGSTELPDKLYEQLGRNIAQTMKRRLTEATVKDGGFRLRMSNIGSPCDRKLFLQNHTETKRSDLSAATLMKFLYGDILEDVILFLAEASGHKVEGRQDEVEIAGIKGHRDAVIDGMLVDAKSASSYSYKKFASGKLEEDDPFGYIVQLNSYLHAAQEDPILTVKDKAAFLVIDKTLGHICLDVHDKKDWDLEAAYESRKELVNGNELPDRPFEAEPDGKSGNMKLGTFCSYCDMKYECWPELRTFLSSRGPLYLTEVIREPKMVEVKDRNANEAIEVITASD